MQIIIDFVPHRVQRYDTAGDWFYLPDGTLMILVSNDLPEFPDKGSQEAVALHELTEALLCGHAGVTQQQVDDFDMCWITDGEPGEDQAAPYHDQHMIADIVESVYLREAGRYNRGTKQHEPIEEE